MRRLTDRGRRCTRREIPFSPAGFLPNFIYSAHSDCIESVICGGKFVMRDRRIPGEKEILHEAGKVMRLSGACGFRKETM